MNEGHGGERNRILGRGNGICKNLAMKRAWCHPEMTSYSKVQSSDQQLLLGQYCACSIFSSFYGWDPWVPHKWKPSPNIMGFVF